MITLTLLNSAAPWALSYAIVMISPFALLASTCISPSDLLKAHQQSIESALRLHLMWFAFSCTINATIIGFVLSKRAPLETRFVPWIFVVGNFAAMGLSAAHFVHYRHSHAVVARLLKPTPTPLVPMYVLACFTLIVMVICLVMGFAWLHVVVNWERYKDGSRET